MNRLAICLLILLCQSALGYDRYRSEAEVPEPLLFDLVRRINSDKGEFEMNSLFVKRRTRGEPSFEVAPEIEWAFGNGRAIELELPTADGVVESYKVALQFQIPSYFGQINGVQVIYEKLREEDVHEVTPLYLLAHRFSHKWSTLSMVGYRAVVGDRRAARRAHRAEGAIVNSSLFYNYRRVLDLGLELNMSGFSGKNSEYILMPQLHALFPLDIKVQAGFGANYDAYRVSPITAVRLIREYN
jgi:hypothetical protein